MKKRVLLIGIDGLRPDALLEYAPNIRKFGEDNLYTWNSKVNIPISAPSWSTIFTGLSYKNTGVTNNAFTGSTLSLLDNKLITGESKTIFYYLKKHNKNSKVISAGPWDGIYMIANYNNSLIDKNNIREFNDCKVKIKKTIESYYSSEQLEKKKKRKKSISKRNSNNIKSAILDNRYCDKWSKNPLINEYKSERYALSKTLKFMEDSNIDFVTFYTHHVDAHGHRFGHNPRIKEYAQSIVKTDKNIKKLLDYVKNRELHNKENWMVIITTDHGGSARKILRKHKRGREILKKFDNDKQINAGIDQSQLMGIHGLRDDAEIYNKHTTNFVIVKKPNKESKHLGLNKTNKDISPTIIKYLIPGKKGKDILKKMDGKPIV